jgi:hypothetical protein
MGMLLEVNNGDMLPIHENKVLRRYEAFELQIHQ